MAERRMFAKTIVTSDAFLDMPLSARCLYFTFGMFADDDGFVNSPKSIMRQVGASMDDMRILIAKKFIIEFEDGVIVIKHWRINNYLRNDRYIETKYKDHRAELGVDENGAYTRCTNGIPMVDQRYTEDRLGKDSLGEDSEGKDKTTTTTTSSTPAHARDREPPSRCEVFKYFKDELCVPLSDIESEKFWTWNELRGWDCLPKWKTAAELWVARMEEREG